MKKNKNIIIVISLIAFLVFIISMLFFINRTRIADIIIDDYISLTVGEKKLIEYRILPENAANQKIMWQSGDNEIVKVIDGVIEGLKEGNTIIKASSDNGVTSECVVQVLEKEIEKIEIRETDVELKKGEKISLTITITPSDLKNKNPIWISDNPNVAMVDEDGMVTGIGNGSTQIKAFIGDKIAFSNINVTTSVASIELNKNDDILLTGANETLLFKIEPFDSTNKDVIWHSSNPSVISVDSGNIIAKSPGTAKITVTTVDGNKSATSNIKVISPKIFDQRNKAVIEYLTSPTENKVISVFKKMCNKTSLTCHRPNKYISSLTGNINVYQYNYNNNEKVFIASIPVDGLDYYLIPNNTYYLESASEKEKIEAITVTGDLRMITMPDIGNMRDLGGWQADGGKVKYGRIFRSANTNTLATLNEFNYLGIGKVVDLRPNSEIKHTSAVDSIRTAISITNYTNDKNVRSATEQVIKAVVEQKTNVLFNCNIGRDRTGTIAYIIEGILGVSQNDRSTDYELTYFYSATRTRNYSAFKTLISKFNSYNMTQYEQERFINWYLSFSTNKDKDLELINSFRKQMINGNPHMYKLVNGVLTVK